MYFPKVNIYHDNLYEDKKKTSTNKSRACGDQEKKKCNYDLEAERKMDEKKYHCTYDRKRERKADS